MAFAALVGGLVGARVYFLIDNCDDVSDDLLGNLFSGSGLIWYGGAIGGAIAVSRWALVARDPQPELLDLAAVPLAIGYAIGRVGCQLSGDGDYGKAWDGPWAMAYPDGTVPTDTPVHPTPIYETLAMGIGRDRALDASRPLPARAALRALPVLRRARAVPGRVRAPQRRCRARADPGAAAQRRDDRSPAASGSRVKWTAARPTAAAPTPRPGPRRLAAQAERSMPPSSGITARSGRRPAPSRGRRPGRRTPPGRPSRPAGHVRRAPAPRPRSSDAVDLGRAARSRTGRCRRC